MTESSGILARTLLALLVAGVLLILIVLPAERGYDPTGLGGALGLTGLADAPTNANVNQEISLSEDALSFELLPFESLEYKYRLEQGAAMVYAWLASDVVAFDLHAEPDGAEPGFAESFDQGKGEQRAGSYIAPFPGIHGWFWENRTQQTVEVTLVTTGFYTSATLFRDGFEYPRAPSSSTAPREVPPPGN